MFFVEEPNGFTVSSGLDFLFSCRKDYLNIYHQSNVLIGSYCGNLTYNLAVMVAGNYTVIKFHSENVDKGNRGFRLHLSELPRSGKCRRDPSVIQEFVWEISLNFQSNLLASTDPSIFLDMSGQATRRPAVIFYISRLSSCRAACVAAAFY